MLANVSDLQVQDASLLRQVVTAGKVCWTLQGRTMQPYWGQMQTPRSAKCCAEANSESSHRPTRQRNGSVTGVVTSCHPLDHVVVMAGPSPKPLGISCAAVSDFIHETLDIIAVVSDSIQTARYNAMLHVPGSSMSLNITVRSTRVSPCARESLCTSDAMELLRMQPELSTLHGCLW